MKTKIFAEILESYGCFSVVAYVPNVYEYCSSEKYYFTKNTLREAKKEAKEYFKNNKVNGKFYSLNFL